MGHRQTARRDRGGGSHLCHGGQYERARPGDRRVDLGRPRGACGQRADRLRIADLHHPAARQDGPRGDKGDDRPCGPLRLRLVGRIVLHRRPRRGLDHGTYRQREDRHGSSVGGTPRARRDDLGSCQPSPYPPFPPEGQEQRDHLQQGCDKICPFAGLFRREG